MSELKRAVMYELDQGFENKKDDGQSVEVQFNPETLKLTFSNEIKQPEGGDQKAGTDGLQFVGSSTTKLALQLWFDVTAMEKDPVDDVRRLTAKVLYFMKPQPSDDDETKKVPPGVCFHWGDFMFKGMVEALEESLEFFSPDGKPLRASLSLTLTQQQILEQKHEEGKGLVEVKPGHKPPGHAPLKSAKQNESLQKMAGKNRKNNAKGGWQAIAAANDIEDPLRMAPGQLVNLNAAVSLGGGSGAPALGGGSFGASAPASAGVSGGLNASLGGASARLAIG
jgi:hypothetical protein